MRGEGPGGGGGAHQGWGLPGSSAAGTATGWCGSRGVFPSPSPPGGRSPRPPREQQPRVCIPAFRHWHRAGGDHGGLFCCGPLSPTYMPASEAAALCAARCSIILVVQLRTLTCSRSHTLPHNRGHGRLERRGLTRASFSQP